VLEESRSGWQVASEGPYGVALDLAVDEALRREGLARELIRALNDLRKRSGLQLDDRVAVEVAVEGELGAAVDEHGPWIAQEVLAVELSRGPAADGEAVDVAGAPARVALEVRR